MQTVLKRLASLRRLTRPLALAFVGIVILSLGAAFLLIDIYRTAQLPPIFQALTLQFLPQWVRGVIFLAVGLAVLAAGLWSLSGVVVITFDTPPDGRELVVGYQRSTGKPQLAVISGGAGLLILASLGRMAERLTCITPVQDAVEYYYRASSLFNFENVMFVAPTPTPLDVEVTLDDGTRKDIRENLSHNEQLAARHATDLRLSPPAGDGREIEVTQVTLDALAGADAIILGPGSLFEAILPNLLIPAVREAIARSSARTIYICNLMTEPGLTTGFGVADHIRQFRRYGGFAPDYVLVNTPRIDPEVRQVYAAAHQTPVYLAPEEYEETMVRATAEVTTRDLVLEGSVVVEADLASSVVQLTASLDHPGESRTVRVLRHDPDKLAAAIMEILRRD
ncbi:MAG: 2-phospho-L-lactate transferase CofD family protein [Chloroflexota bacterium]